MAKIYTKNTWTDEELADDARYDILDDEGEPISETVDIRLVTDVVTAGTSVTADRMNNIEEGIDSIDTLLDSVNTLLDSINTLLNEDGITTANIDADTLSGDGTILATVTGTLTTDKQLTFDVDGNIIASDTDIGGGGGGGVQLTDASPRIYTANNTWSKPSGLKYIVIRGKAPGGSGGGAAATAAGQYSAGGGGGEGGGFVKRIDAADLGSTETITIPAAPTGTSGSVGTTGGTISFGSHCSATGGEGGVVLAASAVTAFGNCAAGGVGTGGDVNYGGAPGGAPGRNFGETSHGANGGGAGGGAGKTRSSGEVGSNASGRGAGGGGAANGVSQSARAGGNASGGYIEIWEYVEA